MPLIVLKNNAIDELLVERICRLQASKYPFKETIHCVVILKKTHEKFQGILQGGDVQMVPKWDV